MKLILLRDVKKCILCYDETQKAVLSAQKRIIAICNNCRQEFIKLNHEATDSFQFNDILVCGFQHLLEGKCKNSPVYLILKDNKKIIQVCEKHKDLGPKDWAREIEFFTSDE
jgi:hypothetical protein